MGGIGAGASEKPQNNPNFDFFNYCGITRPVKIYTTPKTYINDITVTSDIDFGKETPSAVLNYAVDIEGVDKDSTACKIEVFDAEGKKVAEAAGTQGKIELENVKLWQPLNSYLYQIKVTAGEDVYTLPYGVRSVRVDGVKFLINEKPFYFKGYGKHEDTFPNGRGINLPMNTKDISIMKWQHANSFRTSHYPYSEEMMRLCDEEGIVVIDETTAVGVNLQFGGGANFGGERIGTFDKEHGVQTQEHHKDVIRDLISRDKNHACVVMWSIIIFAPGALISIFSSDSSLLSDAIVALKQYFAAFIFMDLQYIGQTVFKSLNKKKHAIFFSLLRKVIIVVPLTYIMPYTFNMGTAGVFLAEPVSNVIGGSICFITMLCTVLPELKRMAEV